MTTSPATSLRRTAGARRDALFARVLVGIDGTEAGLEACRQAARLVEPNGWIELVTAVNFGAAALTGWSAPRVAETLERDAENALAAAQAVAGGQATTRVLNGFASACLLREIEEARATLIVLGTHGRSRAEEIVLGGCPGELLHRAPCAVLIARPPLAETLFPRALVVGIDGSREADEAYRAARSLAHRFEVPLRAVTALRGKGVDLPAAHLRTPFVEAIDEEPVEALTRASRDADLLVVGSRGLHGIRALGSVSERVAHKARCSVLVVRPHA
jgi:nucleotide-binding universal stress UspA family protein